MTVPRRNLPRIVKLMPARKRWSLRVTWNSGLETTVDLAAPIAAYRVYLPLRDDPSRFREARIGEHGTDVVWPDGLDMSADLIWQLAREQSGITMSSADFRAWREGLGLTLDGAAEALGISRRMIAYYETGAQPVPRVVALATRGLLVEAS